MPITAITAFVAQAERIGKARSANRLKRLSVGGGRADVAEFAALVDKLVAVMIDTAYAHLPRLTGLDSTASAYCQAW